MSLSMVARSGVLLAVCSIAAGAQSAGAAGRFVPSVEIADSVGKCGSMAAAVKPGEHGYVLRFGAADTAARVVSAVWDSTGALSRYSDARGDLRGPPTPRTERGPRSTITIDFAKNMALLSNESFGSTRSSLMATPSDVLDARHLGPPHALLARLHAQCGAPSLP